MDEMPSPFGSTFKSFLEEEGLLEAATKRAVDAVLAYMDSAPKENAGGRCSSSP